MKKNNKIKMLIKKIRGMGMGIRKRNLRNFEHEKRIIDFYELARLDGYSEAKSEIIKTIKSEYEK